MADVVETIIMRVEGEEKVKALSASIAQEEENLRRLIATLGAHDSATLASAAAVARLESQLKAAQSQVAAAGGASRNSGQALLEFSRAAEDAQYGIGGVLNNIPTLIQLMGGGAGLAGVVSLAGVALYQLYQHSDQIAALFGQGHTKTEAEEMDELGKATKRTADEEERYQKLKERERRRQAQGREPEATSKRKKAVDDAIAEGPLDEINKGLDKHFGDQIRRMAYADPESNEAEAGLAKALKNVKFWEDQRRAGKYVDPNREGKAQAALGEARERLNAIHGRARENFRLSLGEEGPVGESRTRDVERAARAHPGDFGPDGREFADRLKGARGESAEQRDARERDEAEEQARLFHYEAERRHKAFDEKGAEDATNFTNRKLDEVEAERRAEKARKDRKDEEVRQAEDAAGEIAAGVDREFQKRSDDQLKALAGHSKDASDAEGQLMKDLAEGPRRHKSSVIGAEGLAASIQSAVGGDEQLQQLKKINETLQKIATARAATAAALAFGGNGNLGVVGGP